MKGLSSEHDRVHIASLYIHPKCNLFDQERMADILDFMSSCDIASGDIKHRRHESAVEGELRRWRGHMYKLVDTCGSSNRLPSRTPLRVPFLPGGRCGKAAGLPRPYPPPACNNGHLVGLG